MHYTSIENIHKVIAPLFLNDLKRELAEIKEITVEKTRTAKLRDYQTKLASLTFLDPAWRLRQLPHGKLPLPPPPGKRSPLPALQRPDRHGHAQPHSSLHPPVLRHRDQRLRRHRRQNCPLDRREPDDERDRRCRPHEPGLPAPENLRQHYRGNALRLDWETVVPKTTLNYIMGNPPFVGNNNQSNEQRADMQVILGRAGKTVDYVAGWYFKAAEYIQNTEIRVAFVSTNSITQGEQVAAIWKSLYSKYRIHIDYAHRTFRWDSEASLKAHVHCVIIAFSVAPQKGKKILFTTQRVQEVENINAYLMDAPDVFIESRKHPLCNVPEIRKGNQPTDGGHLIIEATEIDEFLSKEPLARPYIKRLIGAKEYINRKPRYCLWLVNTPPSELRKMPLVMDRIRQVREMRLQSPDAGTRRLADVPTVFRETNNPKRFIVVPSVSSERRKYVPIGFLDGDTIATNLVLIIPDAPLYLFGILTSNVHMAWMRAVCGG